MVADPHGDAARVEELARSVRVHAVDVETGEVFATATLDEVPDEELDRLAGWGVSGLWLIGLWERSAASKAIKQRMGNPEAVASAYSLYDYTIAADLGGEAACEALKARAAARGTLMGL